jgi:hypothetical protein
MRGLRPPAWVPSARLAIACRVIGDKQPRTLEEVILRHHRAFNGDIWGRALDRGCNTRNLSVRRSSFGCLA